MNTSNTFTSAISSIEYAETDKITIGKIRPAIVNLIKKEYPHLKDEDCIAITELNKYREDYIASFLAMDVKAIENIHKAVLRSIDDNETSFVQKIEEEVDTRNYGQKIADKVASFGGSWTFIISFFGFILIWILINVILFLNKGFDPYPFILLNLLLSCLAALQAPVIMMSQNRQEEKDRERAKKDYLINLKSELEIRLLDEKLDHLLMHQQEELIEIQKIQIEIMNDILNKIK